ncbi:class I SAM-dependent methyltransferase [Candidatus Parcubacteria bacterium]|nr:class I SAM-dependent methyltransferase [Candidatus Parcubacteria bacterium]
MGAYDIPFWSKSFYDHKARWIHYYYQVQFVARQIRQRNGDPSFSVLEIGPSHGFVTEYLRKFGVKITTLDNKKEYKPDVLADVLKMPLPDNSFDMVLICEVLEHLPFEDFEKAMKEIYRVTKSHVLFSSPDVRRVIGASIKLPFLKTKEISLRFPTFTTNIPAQVGHHQWEMGKREFSPKRFRKILEDIGFTVIEEKVFSDTPKNHYFLLKK